MILTSLRNWCESQQKQGRQKTISLTDCPLQNRIKYAGQAWGLLGHLLQVLFQGKASFLAAIALIHQCSYNSTCLQGLKRCFPCDSCIILLQRFILYCAAFLLTDKSIWIIQCKFWCSKVPYFRKCKGKTKRLSRSYLMTMKWSDSQDQ